MITHFVVLIPSGRVGTRHAFEDFVFEIHPEYDPTYLSSKRATSEQSVSLGLLLMV